MSPSGVRILSEEAVRLMRTPNVPESDLKARGLDTIFLMTEKDKPAYGFYKKIGFEELPGLTSFWKRF